MADGIGLSIGATSLRAVAVGRAAVTRAPVLTRYPHRPSEVGTPGENPHLTERGLVITDFVDRVGDPVAILAADGSAHRASDVLADALRALLLTLTGGRPATEPVAVAHPAHWHPAAVEALRGALAAVPGFRGARPVLIISDAVTTLTALQDDPGVPSRGVLALCDVGGTGASITLVDAAAGFRPIGTTVRYTDFSGDLVDQALLTRVLGDLGTTGAVDLSSTSAIGSLSRLRGQCRGAKERLCTSAVTSMAVELPGRRTEVRVTRLELDEAVRPSLGGLLDVVQETLQRNRIRPADLAGVASVGGGARLPILTTMLSEHLRVPVITSGRPELTAAIGGGLRAVRAMTPDGATSMAPAAGVVAAGDPPGAPASSTFRALAWSDADDLPEPQPAYPSITDDGSVDPSFDPRPQVAFAPNGPDDPDGVDDPTPIPWHRRPAVMAAAGLLVAVTALGGAAFYVLRNDESPVGESTTTATPSLTAPAPTSAPPPVVATPPQETPTSARRTTVRQAPPPSATRTRQAPPATRTAPGSETAPPPEPTTETPTTQAPTTQEPTTPPTESPSTPPPLFTLPYETIPGLPFVPAPIQPPPP